MISAFGIAAAIAAGVIPVEIERAIDGGRFDQARVMIARSLETGTEARSIDPLLAKLAAATGAHDQAFARYAALAAANPGRADYATGEGLAALALGRDGAAAAALTRATKLAGGGWRSWNGLGVLADRERDYDRAREMYEQALALAPDRPEVLNNLGWSNALQGRFESAIPLLERAVTGRPDSRLFGDNLTLVRDAMADALPQRGSDERADAFAARLNDAGVIALSMQQRRRASAAFTQAIEARGAWYARAANNLALAERK